MDPSSVHAWKHYYELAMRDADPVETKRNVYVAEDALFFRWQALAGNSNHHDERAEMQRASADLLRVKTQRLGWPGVES